MDFKIQELMDIISKGETLKVEFKSDLKQLPDRELVATVMNLSNALGAVLIVFMKVCCVMDVLNRIILDRTLLLRARP